VHTAVCFKHLIVGSLNQSHLLYGFNTYHLLYLKYQPYLNRWETTLTPYEVNQYAQEPRTLLQVCGQSDISGNFAGETVVSYPSPL
jgi:hypothetical protein